MANEDKRTNLLKELVQTKLKTLTTNVYFENADTKAMYPHIVYSFGELNLGDLSREDYTLDVDVWDKGETTDIIDNLCDSVEDLLHQQNLPQTHILPTFYKIDRKTIPDTNKQIRHRLIRFQIQNYER